MAKETKEQAQTPDQPDATQAKKKSIMPLLIYGGGGLLLLAATAVVTVLLLQSSPSVMPEVKDEVATGDSSHNKLDSLKQVMKAQDTTETHTLEAPHESEVTLDSAELALLDADSSDDIEKMLEAVEAMNSQVEAQAAAQIAAEATVADADTLEALGWLDEEKKALEARKTEIAQREADLNAQEEKISRAMLKLEQASSDRVTNLAKLYDGMEAKAVANLMANLDDETVVAIIPRMKPKSASAVLSLIPPARAAGISRQIINLAGE